MNDREIRILTAFMRDATKMIGQGKFKRVAYSWTTGNVSVSVQLLEGTWMTGYGPNVDEAICALGTKCITSSLSGVSLATDDLPPGISN